MYYEVDVDLLFLENLWMNIILLLLTAWCCRLPVIFRRILLSAVLGSGGACVMTVYSAALSSAAYFFCMLVLSAAMTTIGLPGKKRFLLAAVGLYLEGFALGGILRFLKMLDPFGGTHIWLAEGISAVILLILEGFLRSRRKKASLSKETMLYCGVRRIQVHAWYDTGNGLYDPFNGKPVSILEQSCMEQLLAGREQERIPRKIPYRTIDREGVLDVYILDAMEIGGPEEQIRIERPEVACMPEKIGSCQLLLHRDLLPS